MTPSQRYQVRDLAGGSFAIIDTQHGKSDGYVASLCIGYIESRDTADLIVEALNKISPVYEAIGELVTLPPTPPELRRWLDNQFKTSDGRTVTEIVSNPDLQPNWFHNALKATKKTAPIETKVDGEYFRWPLINSVERKYGRD